jgi:hypothetical protein
MDYARELLSLNESTRQDTRMNQIEMIQQHLIDADGVSGVLVAGWQVFELARAVAGASVGQTADMYPAFTFARGAAVSGRNAIAFAPSLPADHEPWSGVPAPVTGDVYEVADAVAELASVLSGRLREAAGLAADPGDRVACENAAGDAERISRLLAKGE